MRMADTTASFYTTVPIRRGFRALMDPAQYTPLPSDWTVGIADIVQSTKAIAEQRYKAVNMAGAAVIAALTNALGGREFPFVFGGDGASFAVPPRDTEIARGALAATAAWADSELGLTLRVALVPIAAIRAQGLDVRVARFGPSENLSYAMFSGGGLAWADGAVKRGDYAITPAPPGSWPDLTGLSCRFQEFRAAQGMILSLIVLPAPSADAAAFRALTEEIVTLVEASPDAGRPVPAQGPAQRWPPQGVALETRTAPGGRLRRRAGVLAKTLIYFLIMRTGRPIGSFVPARYMRQIRRRAAHDPRLHTRTRRRAGAPAGRGGRRRALWVVPAGCGDDDLLHAVTDARRSCAFRRRRARRLCGCGKCPQSRACTGCGNIERLLLSGDLLKQR
jgi:Protein of unknown function (DUF3095)